MTKGYSEKDLSKKGYTVYKNTLVIMFDQKYIDYMDQIMQKATTPIKRYEEPINCNGYRIIPVSSITNIAISTDYESIRFTYRSSGMQIGYTRIPLMRGVTVKSIIDDIYGSQDNNTTHKSYSPEEDLISI